MIFFFFFPITKFLIHFFQIKRDTSAVVNDLLKFRRAIVFKFSISSIQTLLMTRAPYTRCHWLYPARRFRYFLIRLQRARSPERARRRPSRLHNSKIADYRREIPICPTFTEFPSLSFSAMCASLCVTELSIIKTLHSASPRCRTNNRLSLKQLRVRWREDYVRLFHINFGINLLY